MRKGIYRALIKTLIIKVSLNNRWGMEGDNVASERKEHHALNIFILSLVRGWEGICSGLDAHSLQDA